MAEEEGLDFEYHQKSKEDDQDPNTVVDEDTLHSWPAWWTTLMTATTASALPARRTSLRRSVL